DDHQFRIEWFLVRIGYAGELFDLAGQSFFVKSLHVARHKRVERRFDEDFHEDRAVGLNRAAHFVTDLAVRRDGRRDHAHAVAGQQPADVTDAPDVGVAVFFRKAKTLAQIRAHFIAVEHFYFDAASAQLWDERIGECCFAGARQSRKP